MQFLINNWLSMAGLIAAMLVLLELGRWIGRRRLRLDPTWDNRGISTLESTLLALLGLLLAFTFSGAWSRFDARRALILEETNAIGTAWLRLDLLPEPGRGQLQASFRRYTELRIAATQANEARPSEEVAAAQQAIWTGAVAGAQAAPDNRVATLLLPAVNAMFDIATARYQAVLTHPPAMVYWMLLVLALLATTLVGYGMAAGKRRSWLHICCFVGALLLTIYVSLDLEYPRRGHFRVDKYDQQLIDLRAGMK